MSNKSLKKISSKEELESIIKSEKRSITYRLKSSHDPKYKINLNKLLEERGYNSDLSDLNLTGMDFSRLIMINFVANNTNFSGCNFKDSNLSGMMAIRANFTEASFNRFSNLRKANYSYSTFNSIESDSLDLMHTELIHSSFYKANLTRCFINKLNDVDLTSANLQFANFVYSFFDKVNMRLANLQSANFILSKFSNVDFNGANLSDAECKGAEFIQCDMTEANLKSTDFSNYINDLGTKTTYTKLLDVELENSKAEENTTLAYIFKYNQTDSMNQNTVVSYTKTLKQAKTIAESRVSRELNLADLKKTLEGILPLSDNSEEVTPSSDSKRRKYSSFKDDHNCTETTEIKVLKRSRLHIRKAPKVFNAPRSSWEEIARSSLVSSNSRG